MRFVNFIVGSASNLGVLKGDLVIPGMELGFNGSLLDLIDAGPAALDDMKSRLRQLSPDSAVGALADLTLGAPVEPRRTLFCAGKNYADHAAEYTKSGYDKPDAPEVVDMPVTFFKLAECVVGPFDAVEAQAAVTREMDYEAELAAVLSRGGRRISLDQAADHIFGYMLVNDFTARDWQKGHDQWVVGKSFDGYCPMGTILVTADEVSSPADLSFECHVNGEHRQSGNPAELTYDVPQLIEYFSQGITLVPGDIIATGSPLGPGIGFNPPRFLKPGDTVRITSDLLGRIETPII